MVSGVGGGEPRQIQGAGWAYERGSTNGRAKTRLRKAYVAAQFLLRVKP